jgi:acetolactate synthase-1/2/3 large subunit
MNGMELDTAVRHRLNVIWVISNNAGWTAARKDYRAGQHLGARPYDEMAAGLGCHAEKVEDPEQIRPALERAKKSGRPALLNVITDPNIGATTARFATYVT